MMKRIFILVFLFLSKISFANSIVADLSIDSININTGFNGAELFLFGTYDGQDGDDLFIFIEGPKTEATIYKKEYFYGIWWGNAHFIPACKRATFCAYARVGEGRPHIPHGGSELLRTS